MIRSHLRADVVSVPSSYKGGLVLHIINIFRLPICE
jgi:hypothetical protein